MRRLGLTERLYLAGVLAPIVFLLSVVIGGQRRAGYSHVSEPVSALGMSGAADGWAINAAWAVTGLLVMGLGAALWRDQSGPGRLTGAALLVAGAASAAIAVGFPMDPPGVQMSTAQAGHNVLVVVSAVAFAAAMLFCVRHPAAPLAYRRLTWAALAAMGLGGVGAALAHSLEWPWIGAFERVTQSGYHGWLLVTGALGLSQRWSTGRV